MRFLKPAECNEWIAKGTTRSPATHTLSVQLPSESGRLLFIARVIAEAVTFRQRCLLRMTEWNIWPSNNNWHLYYLLRQSYGDHLMIEEAPGHLFLEYEAEDLSTFLHLAMLFGWDAELRPSAHYIWGRLSHDEFLDLYCGDPPCLADLHQTMIRAKLKAELGPYQPGSWRGNPN